MRSQDPVVVGDEHQPAPRVQRYVGRGGQVRGHHDRAEGSLDVEDVDLLSEVVDNVEVVADPVDGQGDRVPGTGYTEQGGNNYLMNYTITK